MNIQLRAVPRLEAGGSTGRAGSGARSGLRRIAAFATRRLAKRRTDLMIEQEAQRLLFWQLLKREVERSRRHETSFTVLRLHNPDADTTTTVSRLRPLLRETDAIVAEWDRVLVLLADTTAEAAVSVTRRLAGAAKLSVDERDWHRIEFPRDALTLGALVDGLLQPEAGERVLLAG